MNTQNYENSRSTLAPVLRIGGIAALALILYSIATMIIWFAVGGQPKTALEAFALLQENKVIGLLRLDALMVVCLPLFYLFFAGICAALWKTDGPAAGLAAALAFVGVTLLLATGSVASMAYLSGRYAEAASEAQKALYLAAGEAVIAADYWHATGPAVGGILMQLAGLSISVIMLRGEVFGKGAAIAGIITYALDLAHILVAPFSEDASVAFMIIGGTAYLVWFPLVGWKLLQLSKRTAV
jgi:hypothetical protein